jgi:hypothetical protein
LLQGTVGFVVPDDDLSRRLSVAMAITQRRGYVLTWFFAAPHNAELQALTNERVIFDSAPPVKVAEVSKPRGGVPGATTSPASGSAAAPEASSAAGTNDPTSADAATSSAAISNQPQTTDAARPSLLRPGETMQSQQGKGEPISKQRLSQ